MSDFDFASRLKSVRKHQGYTQEQLAKITQISVGSIRRYEQGKKGEVPNCEYLLMLAEALDTTPEYLLRGENSMNNYTSAIKAELLQIREFAQLQQIKNTPLNATILSHLELSESLVADLREAWMSNKLFETSCYRNYVREIVLRYCQNRKHFRELFGLRDGMLINIEQSKISS